MTPEELTASDRGDVVVIDVLRASTTAAAALAGGADCLRPCESVEEARALADELKAAGESVLVGGERGGLRIEGFDLGNSPREYAREVVAGKTIVFTTTNGTRALRAVGSARRILFAAAVNAERTTAALVESPEVTFVCSGTDGRVTREDVVVAGWLIALLEARRRTAGLDPPALGDEAALARDAAFGSGLPGTTEGAAADSPLAPLLTVLGASRGGRNLIDLGMELDLEASASVGRWPIVPAYEKAAGKILPL